MFLSPTARRTLQWPFALAVLALMPAGCATYTIGPGHFFRPGPAATRTTQVDAFAVDEISIDTPDGVQLLGASVAVPDATVTVVYFGGNESRVDDAIAAVARTLAPLRANAVMVDYRGYGRSGGTPTLEALKSDSLLVYDRVVSTSRTPVVVHGFSLGSFMASHVAANRKVAGLVLEATAPDVATMARNQIPLYAKPVVRVKIDPVLQQESTVVAVRRSSAPLLLISGSDDPVTPPKFHKPILRASAAEYKRSVEVPGASHGTAMVRPEGLAAYRALLEHVAAKR